MGSFVDFSGPCNDIGQHIRVLVAYHKCTAPAVNAVLAYHALIREVLSEGSDSEACFS